jgi:hypothetical protein
VNTRIVDAERNLPAAVAASAGETAARFRAAAGTMLANEGLAPHEVGRMVRDAIVADRFWVLTHPAWCDVLDARVTAMSAGDLHHGFGG